MPTQSSQTASPQPNCTFSDNTFGININGNTATVINCTFAGNDYAFESWQGGTITSINTILADSTRVNCDGNPVIDGGHNLDDGGTCGFTGTGCTDSIGTSLCNTNPLLDPAGLKNNGGPTQTIALCAAAGVPAGCAAASPAINAGDPVVCAAGPVNDVDQRGLPRNSPCDPACDIGTFEFVPKPLDVDANGTVEVPTDIIYIARCILGLTCVPPTFRVLDPGIPSDTDISCRINQLL
jgi:hypothetical protein